MATSPSVNSPSQSFLGLSKILLQKGLFDEKTLQSLMATAAAEKLPLIHAISKSKKDLSKQVARALAQTFDLPEVDLMSIDLSQLPIEAKQEAKKVAELRAIPVFIRGAKMYIATSDPSEVTGINFFTHKLGKRAELLVVDDQQITAIVAYLTGQEEKNVDVSTDVNVAFSSEEIDSDGDENLEGDDNPVVKFVSGILLTAIRKGASDIHFEPYEKYYRVRLRIDGSMKELTRPNPAWALRIASRIKIISSLDISEKRKPQDGRMKIVLPTGKAIDFRVSTLPTMYGEKIVMRILDPSAAQLGIDALGYEPDERERLLEAINRPYGMVLVTGPTGSGKTVSLYSCLNILNREDINISTAEDPCEIQLAGINQVNVNPAAGLTFASALKSFLRQDPDIIMVGEIRDEETAEISVKAAQTGHLVLATLHTNDAPKTISRLVEIGVKPYNVAAAVILITAQRLGKKLCSVCKIEEVGVTREALKTVGMTDEDADDVYIRWKPFKANKEGCDSCNQGYKGRVGIYQVMPISDEMQRMIMVGTDSIELAKQSKKEGIRDLRQSGLLKYRKGMTSLEEILAITNE